MPVFSDLMHLLPAPSAALLFALAALSTGCGGDDSSGDDSEPVMPDATVADAFVITETSCDSASGRALVPGGPFTCEGEPEYVTIETRRDGAAYQYDIFTYEASHPLSTETLAFPCAGESDVEAGIANFAAPEGAEACSIAGVRPWHSVTWEEARTACQAIGWRMCDDFEIERGCTGGDGRRYTYGDQFRSGTQGCNVQQSYLAPGAEFTSEAPTGSFEFCVSADGVFDLNGNLWEWSGSPLEDDSRGRRYVGAGWKIIAERHQDEEQACQAESQVLGSFARSFKSPIVGFRCCRDAQ